MAFGDPYITRNELKTRLGIPTADTTDDDRLDQAIDAASQAIELFCNRQFNNAGSVAERSYYADETHLVIVDDFHTTTGLVVKSVAVATGGTETETTLSSSEYRVEPLRPSRDGLVSFPYWSIKNLRATDFPVPDRVTDTDEGLGYLKITANWGWSAVPPAVKEAAYILGEEHFKMKEAPFGIANWGEFGPVRVQENKLAYGLLRKIRRGGVRVAG